MNILGTATGVSGVILQSRFGSVEGVGKQGKEKPSQGGIQKTGVILKGADVTTWVVVKGKVDEVLHPRGVCVCKFLLALFVEVKYQ